VRHFEFDAHTLEEIVNGDAPDDERVDLEDITLLTMVSSQESYAKLSLRALTPPSSPPITGDRRDSSPVNPMRRHLYARYGFAAPESNGRGDYPAVRGGTPPPAPAPDGKPSGSRGRKERRG
jgi:hypothetical protein